MPTSLSGFKGPLAVIGAGVGFAAIGSVPVAITFSLGVRTPATMIGMGFVGFGLLLMTPGIVWCMVVGVSRVLTRHSLKLWKQRRRSNPLSCSAAADGIDGGLGPDAGSAAGKKKGRRKLSDGYREDDGYRRHGNEDPDDDEDDEDGEETTALRGRRDDHHGNDSSASGSCKRHHNKSSLLTNSDPSSAGAQYRSAPTRSWPSNFIYIDPPPLIITDHCGSSGGIDSSCRQTTPTSSATVSVVTTDCCSVQPVCVVIDSTSSLICDVNDTAVSDTGNDANDVTVTTTTPTAATAEFATVPADGVDGPLSTSDES